MIRGALIVLVVAFLLTSATHRRRLFQRWMADETESVDQYVDACVRLHVVRNDPKGETRVPRFPDQRFRTLRVHEFGTWIDTKTRPPRLIVDEDGDPIHEAPGVDWFCSEDQEAVLLHDDPDRLAQLVYGSEGAGKSRTLAMWHYFRWLENLGQLREGGQTAPTKKRLEFVRKEMFLLYPDSWFRYLVADSVFVMCDGTRIQLVSTYQQSKAQGSQIQGFNWSWCGRDEAQDSVDVHEDIESRGRSAEGGLYKQVATATAKDNSMWRELRDVLLASGTWLKRSLSVFRSPFITAKFLADKAKTMSEREFRRRYGDAKTGEVDDLLPELAVYYGWDRKRNLVANPQIATDVTAVVLAGYQSYVRPGARFTLLIGHDPGSIYNTSTIWRLLMFGGIPTWTCVGELQTKQTTQHEHARQLRVKLQKDFRLELIPTRDNPDPSSKALVFCDPHGKGIADTDYQTVYMAFQAEGLDVFSPAPMSGKIKRAARIEMVNRLLCGTAATPGVARMVIAQVGGRPVAPQLVAAFEELKKRPGDDNPEGTQRKDEDDKTHAPASAAYCLWPFEQEAATANTQRIALNEARRVHG